jgi:hypothetical protein
MPSVCGMKAELNIQTADNIDYVKLYPSLINDQTFGNPF